MEQIFDYFLGPFLCNLRTTIKLNVVLTIFDKWRHICYVWKIVGTSFQCIIVPPSRAEGLNKDQYFMDPGSQSVTKVGR